ncbi:MAG TPA: hypothetical protein VE077_19990 [Candidatus Methylomirabilis sp.]|nr:hypothetical protein [Candidatus Methylomirabilis sp.]
MNLWPLAALKTMRSLCLIVIAALLPAVAPAGQVQESEPPVPPQTESEKQALLDRVLSNQIKGDEALNLYERIERVETRKSASDPQPTEVKISRVVPAGTGVDHIPVGADGKPTDPDAYLRELVKLEHALSWAAEDGHAQREAYEKVEKKQKERNELIDAAHTAFLYSFVSTETREGRTLFKYRMEPNPAYKATSRATAIFAKIRGYVWIDPLAGQLAKVEGEVTGDISIGLFLGRIYKGSHFMQESYEVSPGVWMPSFSQYDFDGRKLFSSINVHERTFYSHFRRVGPPKEALALIRAELSKASAAATAP